MRKRERWIYRPDPELEDSALWAISMERVGGAAARWSAGVVDEGRRSGDAKAAGRRG